MLTQAKVLSFKFQDSFKAGGKKEKKTHARWNKESYTNETSFNEAQWLAYKYILYIYIYVTTNWAMRNQ